MRVLNIVLYRHYIPLWLSWLLSINTKKILVSSTPPAVISTKSKCPLIIPSSTVFKNRPFSKRTIIAHRGASFSLPEHTLAAYRLALELGADYIEPDLVSTRDGVLIAVHTMDLNLTTNVEQVFGEKRMSFSTHVNRTGYWAYNFDWDEIQTLKVHQRVKSGARSLVYDDMFGIPSLQQILELLHDWNARILPLLNNNTSNKKRSGLYAELKYPEWLQKDAQNLSLVDLFMDQMDTLPFTDYMWQDEECSDLKFDEYLVPPLVVQSFDGLILKEIKSKWRDYANRRNKDNTTVVRTPPMVLLVDEANCWKDEFWFHVGEWKSFLQGIGPDKSCLLGEEARPFINRAKEHELAIHPWTVRGELEFIKPPTVPNVQEELQYWFCTVGVHGIFTENIDVAVQMASVPCPEPDKKPESHVTGKNSTLQQLCYNTDREAQLFVGLASGIMGIFVGSIFSYWLSQSRFCRTRRHSRRQLGVPTHDPEPVEVEMV